jgi:HSP20 family protein
MLRLQALKCSTFSRSLYASKDGRKRSKKRSKIFAAKERIEVYSVAIKGITKIEVGGARRDTYKREIRGNWTWGGDVDMALSPFRGFWDTQSEFDRMFNDVMRDFLGTRRTGGRTQQEQLWVPRLAAYAKDGDLVLHADLPGVSLEDVDITLDANVLTISGERKDTSEEEGVSYYLHELPHGAFRRSVSVPEGVDVDSIKARFENGVLEVVLPGATTQLQPKRIAVEGSDAS